MAKKPSRIIGMLVASATTMSFGLSGVAAAQYTYDRDNHVYSAQSYVDDTYDHKRDKHKDDKKRMQDKRDSKYSRKQDEKKKDKKCEVDNKQQKRSDNEVKVDNAVNQYAKSGDAKVSHSTASASATTGNATNSSLIQTIINIGSWATQASHNYGAGSAKTATQSRTDKQPNVTVYNTVNQYAQTGDATVTSNDKNKKDNDRKDYGDDKKGSEATTGNTANYSKADTAVKASHKQESKKDDKKDRCEKPVSNVKDNKKRSDFMRRDFKQDDRKKKDDFKKDFHKDFRHDDFKRDEHKRDDHKDSRKKVVEKKVVEKKAVKQVVAKKVTPVKPEEPKKPVPAKKFNVVHQKDHKDHQKKFVQAKVDHKKDFDSKDKKHKFVHEKHEEKRVEHKKDDFKKFDRRDHRDDFKKDFKRSDFTRHDFKKRDFDKREDKFDRKDNRKDKFHDVSHRKDSHDKKFHNRHDDRKYYDSHRKFYDTNYGYRKDDKKREDLKREDFKKRNFDKFDKFDKRENKFDRKDKFQKPSYAPVMQHKQDRMDDFKKDVSRVPKKTDNKVNVDVNNTVNQYARTGDATVVGDKKDHKDYSKDVFKKREDKTQSEAKTGNASNYSKVDTTVNVSNKESDSTKKFDKKFDRKDTAPQSTVNVNNTVNQYAQSGDATAVGNNTQNSAKTGDASNYSQISTVVEANN